MTISKSFIYLIVFSIGIFFSKMFLEKDCPVLEKSKSVTTIKESSDTTTNKKEIKFDIPAKIKKKLSSVTKSITDASPLDARGSTPAPTVESFFVACFDSVKEDFEAHICFDSETRKFFNRFIIPEKTINNKKETLIDSNSITTKIELPEYLIGFGIKSALKQNTINTLPFVSFTANRKLWFMIGSIEIKALTRLSEGALKMEPELEGKIYVPL